MRSLRLAADVAIVVLATLLVAAAAYGGMASQLTRTAVIEKTPQAREAAGPPEQPSPTAPPAAPEQPAGLFAIDQDMVDDSVGWMLLSDCPLHTGQPCRYATARTDDAGYHWTASVQIGAMFPADDGGAPAHITFFNRHDGFVYGPAGAYVTHDGGSTWQTAALPGFISSIVAGLTYVWEVDYPCAKGLQCPYEVRSSADGGRSWSNPHQLPDGFSPETVAAFSSGVVMSSVPVGDIVITTDSGHTWSSIKSPCAGNPFRGRVATFDGTELWELCLGYPSGSGAIADRSLFVSADGGKTWSARQAAPLGDTPGVWLVSNALHDAVASGDQATFITRDGGKTWSQVSPSFVNLSRIFRINPTRGVAVDTGRNVLETIDGGAHWQDLGALPSKLG